MISGLESVATDRSDQHVPLPSDIDVVETAEGVRYTLPRRMLGLNWVATGVVGLAAVGVILLAASFAAGGWFWLLSPVLMFFILVCLVFVGYLAAGLFLHFSTVQVELYRGKLCVIERAGPLWGTTWVPLAGLRRLVV